LSIYLLTFSYVLLHKPLKLPDLLASTVPHHAISELLKSKRQPKAY